MSDYELPFHIQEEIMKSLPVKSLIQFRGVSKAWKSLIDNSNFIAAHSLYLHTQQRHLLVSYENMMEEKNYVSYIDDDTFPRQRSLPTSQDDCELVVYEPSLEQSNVLEITEPLLFSI